MISVEEARLVVQKNMPHSRSEVRSIVDALQMVLQNPVCATEDSPAFDNSQMDGYACRVSDITSIPYSMPVAFEIPAGLQSSQTLPKDSAARIFTGAPLPAGADCVIRQEDVKRDGDMVTILIKPETNQFIRRKGSDFFSKETLIHSGEKLNGPRIALMASQGISEVTVNRRPSIGYVLSGNELVLPGESMQPGSIRSCNGELFETLLAPWAEEVVGYGKIGDSLEDVLGSLDLALPHDIFLISGGASVGDYDFTRRALKERGFAIHFEQVAIRPGKPLIFATKDDHAVFGVPGNPVSTVVTCLMFLQVAAAAFSGQRLEPKRFMARLENSQKKPQDLSVYARGNFRVVNQENLVKIDSNQSSGAIGAFTKANCLVSLPAGRSEFQTGDLVAIVPIEDGIPWN